MNTVKKKRTYLALVIAVAVLVLYLPALQNDFVNWDDQYYIFENPHIRSFDPAFLKWALFDFYASNWHPLTWMSHAIDYAFWGLNPMGHHLTSIILHTANTFLVVLLIIKILEVLKQSAAKKTRLLEFLSERTMLITGGVTGLLFGIHPVHVESVAWVSERKDLLCALFFILSIITYTSYVKGLVDKAARHNSTAFFLNRYYFIAVFFFILALLSKPMAVTLPVVLLILDWYPFQRIHSVKTLQPVLAEKIPFFAFTLVSAVLTVLAQKSGAALAAVETIPFSLRIFVAAKALLAYLWHMIWPLNLIPFYQHYRKGEFFEILEYIAPIVVVAGITAACVLIAKRRKMWATAWGYYVVTLIPVLGIVQVGSQLMADRYTYLPSLGPFFLMGLFAAGISEKKYTTEKQQMMGKILASAAAVVMLVSLSSLTLKQIAVWKDTISLWNRVIEKDPSTWSAYKERAEAYKRKGEFDKAIQDYSTTIALDPRDCDAYYNRGLVHYKIGQPEKALEDYDAAISLNPRFLDAYNNRGVVHTVAGAFDKAAEDFSRLISLSPNYADAYRNRGFAFFSMGQYKSAVEDFDMAIRLDPSNPHAYYNRGNLYAKMRQQVNARADFTKACGLGDEDGCKALRKAASTAPARRNEFMEFVPPRAEKGR